MTPDARRTNTEQLRDWPSRHTWTQEFCVEAADEIESLQAENEKFREALKDIAGNQAGTALYLSETAAEALRD